MLDTLQGDNPFVGDSATSDYRKNYQIFIQKLQDCKDGNMPFTLIFRDPFGNCFIQNPFYPEADPIVTVEEYERTEEENDDLGITDMVV